MILAGDEAQVQFATVGVRPHLSGPRESLASPGGRSAFRHPTFSGSVSHLGRTAAACRYRPQESAAIPGGVKRPYRVAGAYAVMGIPPEPKARRSEIGCSALKP